MNSSYVQPATIRQRMTHNAAWGLLAAVVGLALAQALLVGAWMPAGRFAGERAWQQALSSPSGLTTGVNPYPRMVVGVATKLSLPPSVRVGRVLSAAFGAATLVVLFFAARLAFPARRLLHVGVPALLAFTPSFVLASAQATPQTALAFLAAVLLCLALWTVRQGVTLFGLAGAALCLLVGWQVDWGFWWLVWPSLAAVPLAIWHHRNDEGRLLAQSVVLVGVGLALTGGIVVLRASGQLLPWLRALVRGLADVVAHSVWPDAATAVNLARRYWADLASPGRLWFAPVVLLAGLSLVGVGNVAWQERGESAEILTLVALFALAPFAGALLVPGSVSTWPAPAWPGAALVLALGWTGLVPPVLRPYWLLAGLLAMELLALALLVG